MDIDTGSCGRELGIKDEVIKKACSISIRAHQAPAEKPFLVEKIRGSPSQVVIAFSGAWTPDAWSARDGTARAFGETEVNLDLFPSLRSIGNDITAKVNEASMIRFLQIMEKSALRSEMEKATRESKPIIFAGHSSGGPIAIYATIWLLEEYKRLKKAVTHGPFCLTFGSPLTTDRIFCHAVRREEWSDRFVHFVMIHDIAPRILLVPLYPTKEFLEQILPYLISPSAHHKADSIDKSKLTAVWSRVGTRAATVGKGSSKDEKARILSLQHWVEAIDPRHRYGHNLQFYFVTWLLSRSNEEFFDWLDKGEGREVNIDRCPRAKLHQQCVKYLGPTERMAFEIIIESGKFSYKQTGEILDTRRGSKDAKWIFVLSTSKDLYVGMKSKGTFQHSSFLAGEATLSAGRLHVENGFIKEVWPHSGHYLPTEENLEAFMSFLKEKNVDLTNVNVKDFLKNRTELND